MRLLTKITARHAIQAMLLLSAMVACTNDGVVRPLLPLRESVAPTQESRSLSDRNSDIQAITAWNVIALSTTAAALFDPPQETRNVAIVSAAVNDAVCSVVRDCVVYARRVDASRHASIQAAVAAAAHRTLATLYPSAASALDARYQSIVDTMAAGAAHDNGIAAGEAAAAAVLATRVNDHSADAVTYTPSPGLGSWVPTPPAFAPALEPGWGRVRPFVLETGSQFRPPAPPAPGSDAAVRDFVEVASIGALNSATRTPAQTEVARFWVATAPQNWNQVVRQLVNAPGMNAAKAAHAYMLLNLAGADAIIAAWDTKFTYNQWRPLTYVESPLDDGSALTVADPSWMPLVTTPRFPDYICGHSTYAGAAERVMTAMFGEHPSAVSITSATAGGVTHTYQNFHTIADEVTDARVWAGIHWRTSCVVGRAVGNAVGSVALLRLGHGESDDDRGAPARHSARHHRPSREEIVGVRR